MTKKDMSVLHISIGGMTCSLKLTGGFLAIPTAPLMPILANVELFLIRAATPRKLPGLTRTKLWNFDAPHHEASYS